MKRKFAITFIVSLLATMMSFCALATEVLTYDTMLIAEENDTMLIQEEDVLLISPAPNRNTIKVQLNGELVDFTDAEGNVVNPKMIQNRTMVPMRKIFEIFQAEVNWNNETRTVVATTAEKEITLTIDSTVAKVKDLVEATEKEITLDAAPVLLDNRTMVPVRFIAESLEKQVGWDPEQKTVIIIDADKLAKDLEESLPVLQKLLDLELEPINYFKTNSEIEGKLVYKDPENKLASETVKITGDLNINMNQEREMEIYLDLTFSGKGTIYNSLVEAGAENIKFCLVIADDHAYMMIGQKGEEVWLDLGSEIDMSALETFSVTDTPNTYKEFVEILISAMGELNVDSYATIKEALELIGLLYSGDALQVIENGNKVTVKMEIDLKKILNKVDPTSAAAYENAEFKISMVQKAENKKVESAKVDFEFVVEEPTTKESIGIDFGLDMDYKNVGDNFDIELPNVEAIPAA